MEAKELRIGNYHLDETNNVSEISGYFVYELSRVENSSRVKSVASKFKPIPLTEEWLLKFGFDKTNDFDLVLKLNSYQSFLYDLRINEFFISIGQFSEYSESFDIKHVHQLQNLYFALTNQELTLNQ